jgi:hypothetical protein
MNIYVGDPDRTRSGFRDQPLPNARGANGATQRRAAFLHAHVLKVGHETAFRDACRVQTDSAFALGETMTDNRITGCGLFAAKFTNS